MEAINGDGILMRASPNTPLTHKLLCRFMDNGYRYGPDETPGFLILISLLLQP